MASSSQNKKLFPNGSITELFCFRPSSVVLMDYDENQTVRLVGLGQFVVYLMMNTMYPILMTVCSIDGFHFPLTKDTVIFRMAKRTFAVALPGLLYGLQFPDFCDEALLDTLERVFMKYGHYAKVVEQKGLGYSLTDTDVHVWYKLRLRVEPMAYEILRKLGHLAGRSRFNVSKYNSSYQRAIRMSATTKVIEDGMINSGTLGDSHIVVAGTNPPHQPNNDLISQTTAYASVSVFTCLVDSLESAEVAEGGLGYMLKAVDPPFQTGFPKLGFKVWKLNEEGVAAFIPKLGTAVEQEKKTIQEKDEKWKVNKERIEASEASTSTSTSGDAKGKSVKP